MGKKKHDCFVCGKVFKRRYDVQRHMVTHTGEKPFQCKHCPSRYTENGNLLKHMRKQHPAAMLAEKHGLVGMPTCKPQCSMMLAETYAIDELSICKQEPVETPRDAESTANMTLSETSKTTMASESHSETVKN